MAKSNEQEGSIDVKDRTSIRNSSKSLANRVRLLKSDDLEEIPGPWQNAMLAIVSDHLLWIGICSGFIFGCFGGVLFVKFFI